MGFQIMHIVCKFQFSIRIFTVAKLENKNRNLKKGGVLLATFSK